MANILLIEDNPADVFLTKEAFKECGMTHNIINLTDGFEASKFFKNILNANNGTHEYPDLILLDLNLPKKNGREVLSEIKSNEVLRSIPVIVVSTSKSEEDINRSYEMHANCYISKPLDLDNFFDIIKNIEKFWINTIKLPNNPK